jgi:hypothetical protein
VAPGDSKALVRAIAKLSGDAALSAAMGERARAMLEGKFRRQLAFDGRKLSVASHHPRQLVFRSVFPNCIVDGLVRQNQPANDLPVLTGN